MRPSDIASALEVHRSAVTHHLRTLQQAGHVTRTTDPADRRSSFITLTESRSTPDHKRQAQGLVDADLLLDREPFELLAKAAAGVMCWVRPGHTRRPARL
ncbi:MarR family transcriptional regulator [Streptomyces sp. NPDC048483]|uniref:MarR family transcriptional regulator n=1 Tax=Streptomyces sp. NPDC048483 TaxID=3154927 RepID=UPI00344408FD